MFAHALRGHLLDWLNHTGLRSDLCTFITASDDENPGNTPLLANPVPPPKKKGRQEANVVLLAGETNSSGESPAQDGSKLLVQIFDVEGGI